MAEAPPALQKFSTGDGAYYVTVDSSIVDPYFVNKGFIIALQADAPMQPEFVRWVDWLLPRQLPDGRFDRYCKNSKGVWRTCLRADADDSMASTTLQMLALALHKNWVPLEQLAAIQKAMAASQKQLASLRTPKLGLYKVFGDQETYYLMDNAEVFEGLAAIGQYAQATALSKAIRQHLRVNDQWIPALPEYTKVAFYPHTLASAYLWDTGIMPPAEAGAAKAQWLAEHGTTWLQRTGDSYAWGLVAWQLRKTAPIQAACWRASLRPFDPKVGWTMLDAFIDNALGHIGIPSECPLTIPPARKGAQ